VKTITVKVPGHLLIPFGVEKWRIEDIKVSAVSTDATFFESSAPLCHIDTNRADALRLNQISSVLPMKRYPDGGTPAEDVGSIHKLLENGCQMDATSESKFLSLYFEYLLERMSPTAAPYWPPAREPQWGYEALLPLPQAHLYVSDPLGDPFGPNFIPERMFKADFAF
jgi:hypothetical protein